jgi:hypothetical protein
VSCLSVCLQDGKVHLVRRRRGGDADRDDSPTTTKVVIRAPKVGLDDEEGQRGRIPAATTSLYHANVLTWEDKSHLMLYPRNAGYLRVRSLRPRHSSSRQFALASAGPTILSICSSCFLSARASFSPVSLYVCVSLAFHAAGVAGSHQDTAMCVCVVWRSWIDRKKSFVGLLWPIITTLPLETRCKSVLARFRVKGKG